MYSIKNRWFIFICDFQFILSGPISHWKCRQTSLSLQDQGVIVCSINFRRERNLLQYIICWYSSLGNQLISNSYRLLWIWFHVRSCEYCRRRWMRVFISFSRLCFRWQEKTQVKVWALCYSKHNFRSREKGLQYEMIFLEKMLWCKRILAREATWRKVKTSEEEFESHGLPG